MQSMQGGGGVREAAETMSIRILWHVLRVLPHSAIYYVLKAIVAVPRFGRWLVR